MIIATCRRKALRDLNRYSRKTYFPSGDHQRNKNREKKKQHKHILRKVSILDDIERNKHKKNSIEFCHIFIT